MENTEKAKHSIDCTGENKSLPFWTRRARLSHFGLNNCSMGTGRNSDVIVGANEYQNGQSEGNMSIFSYSVTEAVNMPFGQTHRRFNILT